MYMNENEIDFDTEFMTDEEVEKMLDSLITTVDDAMTANDGEVSIINPYRIQQMQYTYKVLKYLTKGTKSKVAYALHKPYKSMGFVSVTGKNLMFRNMDWFSKAVELASNFEVYPKTDGTVQMNFTFHGITKAID